MTRILVGFLGIAALVAVVFHVGNAQAAPLSTERALAERSIGSASAPVTMYEYSSLGCPHCANFHEKILPKIKKAYIDTGKLRLVLRDFPLGAAAMDAHLLTRCVDEARYHGMRAAYFSTLQQWGSSATPRADLIRLALLAGLSPDDAKACLSNKALFDGVSAMRTYGNKTFGINGTPTFMIEGTKIPGVLPYEDFADIIDKKLAAKGAK